MGAQTVADPLIYHICKSSEWTVAEQTGIYAGSSQDQADGFIHFSDADQVIESAAKHRAGQSDLVLLAVDADALGKDLKWEHSRGGALFPHLYGELPVTAVVTHWDLPLAQDGRHQFPAHFTDA